MTAPDDLQLRRLFTALLSVKLADFDDAIKPLGALHATPTTAYVVHCAVNVPYYLIAALFQKAQKRMNRCFARGTVEPLGAASVELLRTVKRALLPRPGKEHYQFGVRDLVKMVKGLQLASKSFHDNQASSPVWLATCRCLTMHVARRDPEHTDARQPSS